MRDVQIIDDLVGVIKDDYKRKALVLEKLKDLAEHDESGVLANALQLASETAGPELTQSKGDPAPAVKVTSDTEETEDQDWINFTPEESAECSKEGYSDTYDLVMFNPDGDEIQKIDLDRDEFLRLKRYLAASRGLSSAKPNDCRIGVAQALRMLVDADDFESQILAAALEDIRNERGSLTPSERLIKDLLGRNAYHRIDEDTVDQVVKEFKLDVKDLREILNEYSLKHPWLRENPAA